MHGPPLGAVRMVLVEDMVVTLEVDKAVGIVHPVGRGHQVIMKAEGVRDLGRPFRHP